MSELIFVTGASGFLGSHIVVQLLEKGYRVRAAVRPGKIEAIRSSHAAYGANFEVVPVSDIATDQFQDAFVGVDALIHSAASIIEKAEPKEVVKSAVEGTLNVVRQAQRAGVKRIVVTSSIATVISGTGKYTDQDWFPVTRDTVAESGFATYRGAKTLAEQEVWKFGEEHPELDITTLNPPFLYGPNTDTFVIKSGDFYALSTNLYIYRLLKRDGPWPFNGPYIDVRDAARAHVLALTSPKSSDAGIGRKRVILGSPHDFYFGTVAEIIEKNRPELKDRLTTTPIPEPPLTKIPTNFERLETVLGFKKEEFKSLEETVLDTVDGLIKIEKEWVAAGTTIDIPSN